MGQSFEKRELHHSELIPWQFLERRMDMLLALRGVDAVIIIRRGIGNGEEVGIDENMVAVAPPHIDAPVLRDTKHPCRRCRFGTIKLMRFAPDGFHHVLSDVGCGKWRQAKPDHLRVNPWPEMIEQRVESFTVAFDADSGQQIIEIAGTCCPVSVPLRRRFYVT